jgi:predicted nucleotidyltransferase
MPLDSRVLGFSNRWYPDALRAAGNVQLRGGLAIRAINAPYFLGTKLEHFADRGKRDYLASHDLEDFIAVVDSRSALMTEIESAS